METENIKVTIEAYFDAAGSLVVEGYDIGKTVEEYWGDSDYEYSVTVASAELKKLYALLNIPIDDQEGLLNFFCNHYCTNTCYSEIRELLEKNGIQGEVFSWT